jgi:hypothetical protein
MPSRDIACSTTADSSCFSGDFASRDVPGGFRHQREGEPNPASVYLLAVSDRSSSVQDLPTVFRYRVAQHEFLNLAGCGL